MKQLFEPLRSGNSKMRVYSIMMPLGNTSWMVQPQSGHFVRKMSNLLVRPWIRLLSIKFGPDERWQNLRYVQIQKASRLLLYKHLWKAKNIILKAIHRSSTPYFNGWVRHFVKAKILAIMMVILIRCCQNLYLVFLLKCSFGVWLYIWTSYSTIHGDLRETSSVSGHVFRFTDLQTRKWMQ